MASVALPVGLEGTMSLCYHAHNSARQAILFLLKQCACILARLIACCRTEPTVGLFGLDGLLQDWCVRYMSRGTEGICCAQCHHLSHRPTVMMLSQLGIVDDHAKLSFLLCAYHG